MNHVFGFVVGGLGAFAATQIGGPSAGFSFIAGMLVGAGLAFFAVWRATGP